MTKKKSQSKYPKSDQGCSNSKSQPCPPSTQDLINKLPEECIREIFKLLKKRRDLRSCATVCWGWADLVLSLSSQLFWKHDEDSVVLSGQNIDDTHLVTEVINISSKRDSITDLCISGWSSSSSDAPTVGVPLVTDRGVKFAAKACRNLKSVHLEGCPLITDRSMEAIALSCSALEALHLCGSAVTDDGILQVAARCANLSCLHIEDCPSVTAASLQSLEEHAKKLKSVSLGRCPWIPSDALVSFVVTRPDLAAVKLQGMAAAPLQIAELDVPLPMHDESGEVFRHLHTLILIDCAAVDGSLARVQLPLLKRVVIQACRGLDDLDLIRLLSRRPDNGVALETLELGMFSFSSYASLMEVISLCHQTIKHLILEYCTFGQALPWPPQDRAGEEDVPKRCPQLELIKVRNCAGIADMFLPWLGAACHEVKDLSFIGMPSTDDDGAAAAENQGGAATISDGIYAVAYHCKKITKLDLSRSGAHDLCMYVLLSVLGSTLRELVLDDSPRFEGYCGAAIAEHCRRLVRLSLRGTSVVDGTLSLMVSRGFQYLEELVLQRCRGITDEALDILFSSPLENLQRVDVKDCNGITAKTVVVYEKIWTIGY